MAVTVTNYDTVNGKIRTKWTGERPGSQAVFHDPLGSVVGIYEDGWLKADRVYDASGETRAEWNDVGTFGWVGGYGYRETRREWVSHYVRARHYSYMTGGWTSVDLLWPWEMAYGYVGGRTTSDIDYSGLCTITKKQVTRVKVHCFDARGLTKTLPGEKPRVERPEDPDKKPNKCTCKGCWPSCSASIHTKVTLYNRAYQGRNPTVTGSVSSYGDCYDSKQIDEIAFGLIGLIPGIGPFFQAAVLIAKGGAIIMKKPPKKPNIPPSVSGCNSRYGYIVEAETEVHVDIYECPQPPAGGNMRVSPPGTSSEPGAIIPKPGGGGGVIRQ